MYLKGIMRNDLFPTGTLEEKASELQRKFESLIADEEEIHQKACKGKYHFKVYYQNVNAIFCVVSAAY